MTRPAHQRGPAREVAVTAKTTGDLVRQPSVADVRYKIKVFADDELVSAGDGYLFFDVDDDLGGAKLTAVYAYVSTVSSSGAVTIQIHNVTGAADMLSTALTIDASEKRSKTAAIAAAIDPAQAAVADGDEIRIDVDGAGTGAKGLLVTLVFS